MPQVCISSFNSKKILQGRHGGVNKLTETLKTIKDKGQHLDLHPNQEAMVIKHRITLPLNQVNAQIRSLMQFYLFFFITTGS